jgi:cellulose synthase/poly-beta-1,6-N-acetylglucosamine synthase-like glycosyltransferase
VDFVTPAILVVSLVVFVQALFALYLMLYAWEHPEWLERNRGPRTFVAPSLSFTALLPARDEVDVIFQTMERVWGANYPQELLEVIVVCHRDDGATIAEARRAITALGSPNVRLVTFGDEPINKPRALNAGFASSRHAVITIFDAEDDIDPDVFNVVNTVMTNEGVGIVQAGVQLMNLKDRWFSIHNCLEYFFWFKSRLHFHARVGMIPLGGNTVFVRRDLVAKVNGWDERCLTEDADFGLRLSTLGEEIRVVYDPEHVTREETPPDLGALIRQRTRWHQGFLQVLRKGSWVELPHRRQRLLALYTFSYPIIQLPLTILWPVALFAGIFLKVPLIVAMASFLPLYAMVFQIAMTVVGAFIFAREYSYHVSPWMAIKLVLTFLPYQWMLGISSARAALRELEGNNNWEKTEHLGAHRSDQPMRQAPSRPLRLEPDPISITHASPSLSGVPMQISRSARGLTAEGYAEPVVLPLPAAARPRHERRVSKTAAGSACSRCGSTLSGGAMFCRRCGTASQAALQ